MFPTIKDTVTALLPFFLFYKPQKVGRKCKCSNVQTRISGFFESLPQSVCMCPCDVVELQKHGGCVQRMELENVAVPPFSWPPRRSYQRSRSWPMLCSSPEFSSPDAEIQFLSWATRLSDLFWRGVGG